MKNITPLINYPKGNIDRVKDKTLFTKMIIATLLLEIKY